MRNKILGLLATALTLLLSGCIDISTVVEVAPDGSGTVEERMLMSKKMAEMVASMEESMEGETKDAEPAESPLLDREELAASAKNMGPGVELVSAEPLETEQGSGYVAKYSFKDINQLQLNQNPSEKAPKEGGSQSEEKEEKEERIRFVFEPGDEPVLVIHTPQDNEAEKEGKEDAAKDESKDEAETDAAAGEKDESEKQMAMMMMRQMFDGLRINIQVKTRTEIVETNATFRDGNTVTLMSMDFGKLLADPEKFEAFAESGADSVEAAKKMMQEIPGIEVDLNPEVRIKMAGE